MYLNCHSYYSLRYGTLSPDQLVAEAASRGIRRLALTDINSSAAAYPFWKACRRAGIEPIFGIEFRNEDELLYIGLARNQEGWAELCGLLSECSLREKPLPVLAPAWTHCHVIYPRLSKPLASFAPNEWLGVRAVHLNRLFRNEVLRHRERLVAWSPFTFLDEDAHTTHRLLRAIAHNTVLSRLSAKQQAADGEYLYRPDELEEQYANYPDLLHRAEALLEGASFDFDEGGALLNKAVFTESEAGDFALVRKLAEAGCKQRYGAAHRKAHERMERELAVIRQQGFCCYFLVTWDIIRYARSVGYHHVGRGSGANSIVAYCMYISDVDPLELDLYFERFINPHRSSPPDFDIDFSWDERDDVIDYVFKRHGPEYVAMMATTVTFKFASVVRELGKVFGLAKADIDQIVNDPDGDYHHELATIIRRQGRRIANFPNYLSIHAGGILISQRPLRYHTALQLMPKGFPIVQIDMYTAEDWGFHKYDILSQRGLGHIKDAVELVHRNQGRAVDIHDVPRIKQDPQVRAQLRSGQAIGCFYIESPAMRGLLSKLACDDYIHLVAASSIIRPGVAQSGMMRSYIERFHDPARVEYLHPVFEEHLGETFGVMVYQEDVMKIAHYFSGLPMDECDVLRRIMSGKKFRSDKFSELQQRYFAGCRERGHDDALSQEVWRQIESFAGYSFCKAHSASFAVESFQSLYLKVYFPLEFMVGVINNFGGFYRTEFYVHEARKSGGEIHAPCVNRSLYLTTIEGTAIYLGFVHLQGLEQALAHRIVRERLRDGEFRDLGDFVQRVDPPSEQLVLLIRIGALRFTGASKYELMWERNRLQDQQHRREVMGMGQLFAVQEAADTFRLPALREGRFDQAFDEIELLGFPLCSPFELLRETPPGTICVQDFSKYRGRQVQILGYYVTRKDLRTKQGQAMAFGTWLDRNGDYFDTTHFPGKWRYGDLRAGGVYLITGKIAEDFGFLSLDADHLVRLPYVPDPRAG